MQWPRSNIKSDSLGQKYLFYTAKMKTDMNIIRGKKIFPRNLAMVSISSSHGQTLCLHQHKGTCPDKKLLGTNSVTQLDHWLHGIISTLSYRMHALKGHCYA